MQLMPATARKLGVDAGDLHGNIDGGVAYLSHMLQLFEGDLPRALAAYNAGPEAVQRYGGVPPYAETKAYVRAILPASQGRQRRLWAARGGVVYEAQRLPHPRRRRRLRRRGPRPDRRHPAGSSPLFAALDWVQGTLLGNLATTAAVIAVAAVGFLMLTGRMDWRRGLTVVIGCFIIFGAVSIVAGIRSLAGGLH